MTRGFIFGLNEKELKFKMVTVEYMPHKEFRKKFKAKKIYKKGDVCWNCGKIMKNPKLHYPIASGVYCYE